MMTEDDIQMCVADCLQDDEIESFDLIMHALNDEDTASWRMARGEPFTTDEVRDALERLMDRGWVTPCAEQGPPYACRPIHRDDVETKYSWDNLWFHLERAGREAVRRWWETEGRVKYPLEQER